MGFKLAVKEEHIMRHLWRKILSVFARLNCACGLTGLRHDDRSCCADLDAARWQRLRTQWDRERCGL
jgi:hypothetical protein